MTSRSLASLLFLLLAAVGCGESHAGEDTSISFDAMPMPDGGGDATGDVVLPPPASDVGSPCESAAMCDEFCIEEDMGFPGGYCTADCSTGEECPSGSICTQVGRGVFICFNECDPSAEERTCRMGYGCASSFMLDGPVCLPGCQDDTDCTGGLTCDPSGGFAGEGSCFDPDSSLGDACTEEAMCPAGAFCLGEGFAGWPGGACIRGGCDPESGGGCDAGEVCLPSRRGGGVCFAGCADDADCRAGYACEARGAYPTRTYCAPGCTDDAQCSGSRVCNPALVTCDAPFDLAELGQECSTVEGACAGGTCLTEFGSGFPFSYCVFVGCDATAAPADSGCPGGNVCIEGADGVGVCILSCDASLDCTRDGYDCLPSDASDGASATACLPACTTDASCANPDFECNAGTGRCRPPFDPAALGDPCLAGDCEGGVCLDEAGEGWPGGACAFPGCRLSGIGPAEVCPTGSTCVDDEAGNPEIGHCLEACTTATSTCRPGYTCVVAPTETDGYCGPGCALDTDCSGGRTCDSVSGLCS